MNNDLLLILIGLGFLLIVGIVFVIYTVKKTGNKKTAEEFLDGLSDKLGDIILETIRSFDPKDIDISEDGIAKIETAILKKIYDVCWDYVSDIVQKTDAEHADFFTKSVLALLQNREFVEDFIQKLVDAPGNKSVLYTRAKNITLATGEERIEELEKREQELTKEFSDEDKYVEEFNENDLPAGDSSLIPTEEDLADLNPQIDEEEELDPENDSSVEVIEEEDNDIYYDKSGRPRSKKTGKWVKVDQKKE
jgi:hypothetical protein